MSRRGRRHHVCLRVSLESVPCLVKAAAKGAPPPPRAGSGAAAAAAAEPAGALRGPPAADPAAAAVAPSKPQGEGGDGQDATPVRRGSGSSASNSSGSSFTPPPLSPPAATQDADAELVGPLGRIADSKSDPPHEAQTSQADPLDPTTHSLTDPMPPHRNGQDIEPSASHTESCDALDDPAEPFQQPPTLYEQGLRLVPVPEVFTDPGVVKSDEMATAETSASLVVLARVWPPGSLEWKDFNSVLRKAGFPSEPFGLINFSARRSDEIVNAFATSVAKFAVSIEGGINLLNDAIMTVRLKVLAQTLGQYKDRYTAECERLGIVESGSGLGRRNSTISESSTLHSPTDSMRSNARFNPPSGRFRLTTINKHPSPSSVAPHSPGTFPELDVLFHYFGDAHDQEATSPQGCSPISSVGPLSSAGGSESSSTTATFSPIGRYSLRSTGSLSGTSSAVSSPNCRPGLASRRARDPNTAELRQQMMFRSEAPLHRKDSTAWQNWVSQDYQGKLDGDDSSEWNELRIASHGRRRSGSMPPPSARSELLSPDPYSPPDVPFRHVSILSSSESIASLSRYSRQNYLLSSASDLPNGPASPGVSIQDQISAYIDLEVKRRAAELIDSHIEAKMEQILASAVGGSRPASIVYDQGAVDMPLEDSFDRDGTEFSDVDIDEPSQMMIVTHGRNSTTLNENDNQTAGILLRDRSSSGEARLRRARSDSCLRRAEPLYTVPLRGRESEEDTFDDRDIDHNQARMQRMQMLMRVMNSKKEPHEEADGAAIDGPVPFNEGFVRPLRHSESVRIPRQGILKKKSSPIIHGAFYGYDMDGALSPSQPVRRFTPWSDDIGARDDRGIYFSLAPTIETIEYKQPMNSTKFLEDDLCLLSRPLASFVRGPAASVSSALPSIGDLKPALSQAPSMTPSLPTASLSSVKSPRRVQWHEQVEVPPSVVQKGSVDPNATKQHTAEGGLVSPPRNQPKKSSPRTTPGPSPPQTPSTTAHSETSSILSAVGISSNLRSNSVRRLRKLSGDTAPLWERPGVDDEVTSRRRYDADDIDGGGSDSVDSFDTRSTASASSSSASTAHTADRTGGSSSASAARDAMDAVSLRSEDSASAAGGGDYRAPLPAARVGILRRPMPGRRDDRKTGGSFSLGAGGGERSAWLRKAISRKGVVSVREL
ncbi:hypothetical protein DFJ73DRAFT_759594 [Zopfochytrium polystomum]|nr:hypothetical protein DFJ73DRAFT_759594 [Zopfochytrium polystomum]